MDNKTPIPPPLEALVIALSETTEGRWSLHVGDRPPYEEDPDKRGKDRTLSFGVANDGKFYAICGSLIEDGLAFWEPTMKAALARYRDA